MVSSFNDDGDDDEPGNIHFNALCSYHFDPQKHPDEYSCFNHYNKYCLIDRQNNRLLDIEEFIREKRKKEKINKRKIKKIVKRRFFS
jgi:hypothetical protein